MKFYHLIPIALCAYGVDAAASSNPAHDALSSMSEAQQAMYLGQMTGHECEGTKAFFRGLSNSGRSKGNAFWSVGCSNGKSYSIEVESGGEGNVLDCKLVLAVGQDCFKKFKP